MLVCLFNLLNTSIVTQSSFINKFSQVVKPLISICLLLPFAIEFLARFIVENYQSWALQHHSLRCRTPSTYSLTTRFDTHTQRSCNILGLTRRECHYWFLLWTPRYWSFTKHKDVSSYILFLYAKLIRLKKWDEY